MSHELINKNIFRFDATVRLLLPNLHNNQSKSNVTVSILSEAQAQKRRNFYKPFDESMGEIWNRVGRFETQSDDSRSVKCHLENMKLSTVPRVAQKSCGSVKNEKYTLLFQSKLRFDNIDFFVCNHNDLKEWNFKFSIKKLIREMYQIRYGFYHYQLQYLCT